MHWLDSFVQGSLASQPHPVIVHACANTEYVSEGYALPRAFHYWYEFMLTNSCEFRLDNCTVALDRPIAVTATSAYYTHSMVWELVLEASSAFLMELNYQIVGLL